MSGKARAHPSKSAGPKDVCCAIAGAPWGSNTWQGQEEGLPAASSTSSSSRPVTGRMCLARSSCKLLWRCAALTQAPPDRASSTCLCPVYAHSYGGLANATGGFCTNPADVLKVRMQMHIGGAPASATATVRSILHQEGPAAFMSGWQASVMRELSYSAIRMGLYDEVKELLAGVSTRLGLSGSLSCSIPGNASC